jgi:proline dehydrogenase
MLDRASKTFFHLLARSGVLKRLASRYGMRQPTSFARRFIAGETIDEAIAAARAIETRGLTLTLDHLGESVANLVEADAATREYLNIIDAVIHAGIGRNLSIKLTQLGLDVDGKLAAQNAGRVAARAREVGRRLWIDMEATPYTERTLALYRRLRESGADVGVCVQAYLHRTPADVEALLPLAPAFRLVKGAYREPPSLALVRKRDVNRRFFELAERLLADDARRAGASLTVATHDPELIRSIETLADSRGIGRSDFEFAMLYGIQGAEQQRLRTAGHRVRVLISYGEHWFPWYMRRLAERPANMMLVARSLFSPASG